MKLSAAVNRGFTLTHYDPECHAYLTRDGQRGSIFGCAALGVGMTPVDFRAVLSEGVEDAFVFTLRSEIWYVMSKIWPWLTNEHCNRVQEAEANGYHDALACILRHEPEVDDQLPPPKPKQRVYVPPPLDAPLSFSKQQIQFIGHCLNEAVSNPRYRTLVEVMAGEFERHVPGFDPNDFYSNTNQNEEQQNVR